MVAAPTHRACTQDKNPGVGLCEWGESQDIYHGASEDGNGEKTRGGGGQKEPTDINEWIQGQKQIV